MLTRISTMLLAFILAGLAPLHGQDQPASTNPSGPIATDRPTVTNSSVVVPSGSFQAENGFLVTNNQGQNIADGSGDLGALWYRREDRLRFTAPDYYYNLNASGLGSGFGHLALGVNEQLGPTPGGFGVSVTAFLSFSKGASGVSSGGYDPGLQVTWSHGLSSKWTAAGMFSLYGPTQDHKRNLTGQSTLLLNRQLTPPWVVFVEYVGDLPERGGSKQLLHFGTTLALGKRQQQLDFHFGVGLTSATVDHFIGAGYSLRFQAIRRK